MTCRLMALANPGPDATDAKNASASLNHHNVTDTLAKDLNMFAEGRLLFRGTTRADLAKLCGH